MDNYNLQWAQKSLSPGKQKVEHKKKSPFSVCFLHSSWLLVLSLVLLSGFNFSVVAQTVTIGTGALTSAAGTNGDPIYRSSATSTFNFSQSVHLVTNAQLVAAGVTSAKNITSMAFYKSTTNTLSAGRTATMRIYMKSSSATSLVATQNFGQWISGATLVYSNTNVLPADLAATGAVTFPFSTPFTYPGTGGIEIAVDFSINTGTGNPTTNSFRWTYDTTTNAQAVGTSNSVALGTTTTLGTTQTRSYRMNLTLAPPPSCLPPTGFNNTALTATSTTLNWTASTSSPSSGYEYEVRTSGVGGSGATGLVTNGTTGAGVVSASITGLNPTTNYFYYVRSNCGAGDFSSWAGPTSFTTPCTAATIPYSEGFETAVVPNLPSCVSSSHPLTRSTTATGAAPRTGTIYQNIRWTPTVTKYVYSAPLAFTGGTSYDMGGWYLTDGLSGWTSIKLYVNTSANVTGATLLTTVSNATNTTYSKINGTYVAPATGTYFFMIEVVHTSVPNDMSIDDLYAIPTPNCFEPTALTISSLTTNGATVSWTAPATGDTPVGYEYAVTTSSTPPASGTYTTFASNAVTGLTANTNYYLHVRSVCSVGTSNSVWATSAVFRTLCNAITTFPWTETFETTSSTLSCFRIIDGNGDGDAWSISTSAPRTGTRHASLYTDFNTSNNDYLITPQLTLDSAPKRLKFWVRAYSTTEVDEVSVRISTTGTALANFSNVAMASTPVTSTTYTEYTVDLTAYANQSIYIAFVRDAAPADGWYLYLDDVLVESTPPTITSFTPSSVCSANLTSSTVTVTGTLLNTVTTVKINGVSHAFTVVNPTTITIPLTSTTTSGLITVENAIASVNSATSLTVNTSPTVSAITGAANVLCKPNTLSLSNATAGGVWSSSDTNIITVSAGGLVTGVAQGTANAVYTVTEANGCSTSVTYAVTVNEPVVITSNPGNQPVLTGNNTTFTVAATGTSLSYQWQESTDGGNIFSSISNGGVYSGATSATLMLTAVPDTMNGNIYQCIVSGASPCGSQPSLTAILTVGNTGIDTQPANVALCGSGDATFTVVPAGTVNSYQWYEDTGLGPVALVDGGNISGATTASLTVSGVDTNSNGYTYYVELVGPAITVSSNTVTLNVYTAAVIDTNPTNQTVCYSGGSVSFTAATSGSNNGVQWQYSTNNSTWANVANGTPVGATYSGATTTTLGVTTTAATPISGTYYYRMMADASAPCTDVYTTSAQLLFNNPTVTTPSAATVLIGNTATFNAVNTATGTVTYQWQRSATLNGTYANVVNGTPANITYNGATTATLSVITTSTTAAGAGNYYRVIVSSNGCSVTSAGALLTITDYCASVPTSFDGSGITGVVVGSTNYTITAVSYSNQTAVAPASFVQGSTANMQVTFATGYTYDSNVWIDFNDDGDFTDAGELVKSGVSTSNNPTTLDLSFAIPITATVGTHRMRLGTADSGQATPTPCYSGTWGVTVDFRVTITAAPSCAGTPATPTAASSTLATCANSTINLSLSGVPAELGYTYQWYSRSLPSGSFAPISGATTASYAYVIPESSEIYATITCTNSGLSANSNTLTVTTNFCNYTVTRSTGNAYNSIMTTGNTYTALSSADDAKTNTISLAGTTFKYNGAAVTGFYATTNGWMTFNTGQTSSTWTNDLTSTGQNNVLAPFWEDLVIKGNSLANQNVSMRYQIVGTLGSGSADIIIEWSEMERFQFPDPNINFQVVLHEADNSIDFNYGQMQLFNGATNTTAYSYSVGMNGTTPSTADSTNRIMLQNNNNSNFSATTVQNSLDGTPDCNSRLRFVPAAALTSGSAPSSLIPVNDEPAGAITLAVNNDPCTSNCGNVYTSKNATGTTGITACSATTPGNADDDVFFSFTTNSTITNYRIELQASPAYDLVVQVLNSALTPVACYNTNGAGLSELIASITLSTSTQYYLRIYDAATGTSGSGEFSVCISQILPPPAYDEPAGAIALTVGTSCTTVASVPSEILRSTATSGIQVCNATTAGTPDDDVWYKFTTPSVTTGVTYTINVQGNSTYNPVAQLFTGVPSTTNSLFCVNATNNGGLETITSSTLAPNTDYYLRVYHSGTGAANGSFSVCVFATLPACVSAPTAPTNASNFCVTTTGTTLSWAAVTNATAYDVYFNGSLVSADQTTLSWVTPVLAGGNYTWSVVPKNPYGSATSCSTFTFTVDPDSVGGTASATASNVCSGTGTSLTLNGNTGTIQWQSSANGTSGWTAITGATSATLNTGNLTTTTYYRARSKSGACSNAFSNVVSVTVDPVSVAGTASSAAGATPICSGTSTSLTLTGSTGAIQWESSANGTSGWSSINAATSASLSTGNLTSTTYYRAVVTSGVCASATSNVVTVTVYEVGTFYADADADGYGSVAATAQTICVPNANIAPTGYSLNNTDCNDGVASINPGAVDVCYDGIDNDCNGNVDNVGLPGGCTPIVSTIPTATCNSIVAYNQIVYTSLVSGAQSYRYRVTEVNPLDDSEIVGTQVVSTMILRNLYLRNLSNYKYNAKYKVEVAVLYNNVWQAYDPNFCYVWTESPVSTIVGCGTPPTQVATINTQILSSIVSRCPGYKYQVTRLDNSYNSVGTAQEIASGIRNFRFSQVTDMIYDAYYEVKCSVRNTDGTYLPYGPSCIVQAPKYPVSELVPAQCEDYAVLNYNEYINAVFVSGAQFYRFRLTSEINNYDVSVDRPLRQFRLVDFPGLVPGETYTVEVAVQMPGQPNVGPYSKACTIIVPFTVRGTDPTAAITFDAQVYPNPFAENFYFKVNSASTEAYTIQVYDMLGKLVETRTVAADSVESTEVGANFPAGVYNVILTQGANIKTLRVVKR